METDGSESGHVSPIANCPHVDPFLKDTETIDANASCFGCEEKKENWICLTCFITGCSRFQHAHMKQHNEESKHPIALSFSDLSIWCYECDSYIRNPKLSKIFKLAHQDKFKANPGNSQTYIVSTTKMTEEELKEYYDTTEELEIKVKQLADMIRNCKNLVVFTGAGVSTSAKIPDYRGPNGVWTLQDKGLSPHFEVTMEQALPTPSHMALLTMFKKEIMKFLVSTNVDGLHRRSGIPEDAMAELHGNCYKEVCSNSHCGMEYLRTFDAASHQVNHITGRKCEKCGSPLVDNIIHFGEDLPINELKKTIQACSQSDMALVLGTSMRVSPANQFPLEIAKQGGKMIIVNLQKTPYDRKANLVIHEQTDKVMQMLFGHLGLEIPKFTPDMDPLHQNWLK